MTTQTLAQLIQQARDEAKTILSALASEIEQLAVLCARKLERLKPLLEQAARVARGGAAPR